MEDNNAGVNVPDQLAREVDHEIEYARLRELESRLNELEQDLDPSMAAELRAALAATGLAEIFARARPRSDEQQQVTQDGDSPPIYLTAHEDTYETNYGDGLYYHYIFGFLNGQDAKTYIESSLNKANHVFKVYISLDGQFRNLPYCLGWDRTLDVATVREDTSRPRNCAESTAVFKEELMQQVWHPTGVMFRHYHECDEGE